MKSITETLVKATDSKLERSNLSVNKSEPSKDNLSMTWAQDSNGKLIPQWILLN